MGGRSAGYEASEKHASNCCGNEGAPPLLFSVMERLCKHVKNKLHTKARHAKQAGKVDGKFVLENECGICKAVKRGLFIRSHYTQPIYRYSGVSQHCQNC